jgi:enoyl-CoA hydratase/carnithine racemase
MDYMDYEALRVAVADGIATVTLDNGPINLLDLRLSTELDRLSRELETDDAVRVVVVESANPDFFIAHADITLIQGMPQDAEVENPALGFFHAMVERWRTLPQITIARIEGRARGGGSEFALSLDLRFGALGRCLVGQPEVALGIIPGGSGTQRLARLMGRGRALEAVLGCGDFDTALAERYGWINRALPADEIGPFVAALARRIASFPREAVVQAKRAVDAAELPLAEGLAAEARGFQRALASPDAGRLLAAFLEAGGQTREVELALDLDADWRRPGKGTA